MRGPNTASAVSVNRMITPVTASLLRRNRRRNRRDLETRCRTVRSSAAAGVMVELVTVVTSQTLREPDPGVDHGDDDVGEQQARAGGDRGEESDSHGPVDVVAVDGLQEVGAAPWIAKMNSIRIAPVINETRTKAPWNAVGMSEGRSACRRMATFLGSPLARAVRT